MKNHNIVKDIYSSYLNNLMPISRQGSHAISNKEKPPP